MEKPKIIDQSSVEQNESKELPTGEYIISAAFKLRNGDDYQFELSTPVFLEKDENLETLKKKALSETSAAGLHNFGMDAYRGRYPDGHPVTLTLQHESGKKIEFTQKFDGRGYPVVYKK